MEGFNIPAFLAVCFALLEFGATSLGALGFALARRTKTARVVFAGGLLAAAIIVALAMFTFFAPEYRRHASAAKIVVVASSLFVSGAGQFIAALRNAGTYAAALVCAVVAIALVASPLLLGDLAVEILGDFGMRFLEWDLPFLVVVSLLPAAASALIAVLFPLPFRVSGPTGGGEGIGH